MALPERVLTANQQLIMDPLVTNFNDKKQRLETATSMYNAALAAMEAHIRDSSAILGVDVDKDYTFDLKTKKFIDRQVLEAQQVAAQPVVP